MSEPRQFVDNQAVREKVPLWVGLAGPSGGGKTYSAHRLAKGMQRVHGGDIFGIDTESKRMLHYADKFNFRHVPFNAPFGSLDYVEAVKYCVSKGAGIIIIDSMSHEHEGEGGCLECHEAELQRLSGGDWKKAQALTMLAWSKPKQARRRMINALLQINAAFIFCFRAKDKIKIKKGEQPTQLGFMPIAGEELVFEMTANALLLPGAGGVPTWMSEEIGERTMIKLPEQFRNHFLGESKGKPLDEAAGEFMARWSMGERTQSKFELLVERIKNATKEERESIRRNWASEVAGVTPEENSQLVEIFKNAKAKAPIVESPPSDEEVKQQQPSPVFVEAKPIPSYPEWVHVGLNNIAECKKMSMLNPMANDLLGEYRSDQCDDMDKAELYPVLFAAWVKQAKALAKASEVPILKATVEGWKKYMPEGLHGELMKELS